MTVKRPVSASLAKAFFYIVLLSILSTGIALLTLTSSLRDAEAINVAGSLRMQSYFIHTRACFFNALKDATVSRQP